MVSPSSGPPAIPSDVAPPSELFPAAVDQQRLWTPWRMRYVGGGAAERGCIFCHRLAADDDVRSLIMHRGERAFAIMNLFPYNTGHLMLAPVQHAAGPETVEPPALAEIALLLPPVLRALRRVLGCDGFNVGLNVGAPAGAGVADHLHQHVVPRWEGDANFMPILAATMVLPELIPVTYAKVRAELVRELGGGAEAACVVLDGGGDRVLLETTRGVERRLPTATAEPDEPLWRAGRRAVDALLGPGADAVGWAGATRAGTEQGDGRAAFTFRFPGPAAAVDGARAAWVPIAEVGGDAGALVAAGLANLAPTGVEAVR